MDNTICEWDKPIFEQLPALDRTKYVSWDIFSCYPGYESQIKAIINSPGFYRNLTPIDGAIKGVKQLVEHSEIYFLTASPAPNIGAFSEKAEWIKEHFGPEYVPRLMIGSRKDIVNADMLIDDKPNLENENSTWYQVCYKQPYNDGTFTWKNELKFN